ncbi:MAG: FHA domain-containing protein [Verrucomicrobia bacterium]|nr:FHA domain-containing protein [Verrucomicrobiota bacterium]
MKTCPQCGAPVTGPDLGGLCSRCVARHFVASAADEEPSAGADALAGSAKDRPGRYAIALAVAGASLEREVSEGEYFVIGRSEDCELRLKDEEVSSHHARLIVRADEVRIEDLASTNGTWVDEDRLTGSRALRPGSTVRLGTTEIRLLGLRRAAPDPESTQAPSPYSRFLPRDFLGGQHFEVLGSIEQGGMGRIDEARDRRLGRVVALKRLARAADELEGEQTARLVAEAQIAGQLEHPGIVPVYELGLDAQGRVFYTMRRIQGATLADILDGLARGKEETVRQYSLSTLLTVFLKVCDAVAYAHSRTVIHRDLKPQNIMVGEFGEVSVLDWGLAKVSEVYEPDLRGGRETAHAALGQPAKPEVLRTLDRVVMGTPGFMAPEQAKGETRHCDERTDIYGLGAVLYSILTCRAPVEGKEVKVVLERTRRGEIERPDQRKPAAHSENAPGDKLPHLPEGRVARALAAVAMKALALNPRDRYGSVNALQADLQAYLSGFATTAELPGLLTLARLWIRRHRRAFALVLLISVLILGFSIELFRMVTELRGTAPTFYDKAVALVVEGRLSEAAAPIAYAIRLDSKRSDSWLLQGHIQQGLLRFPDAVRAYERALSLGAELASARENLALSRQLARAGEGQDPVGRETVLTLHQALLEQERYAEAGAVLRQWLADAQSARDRTQQALRQKLDRAGIGGALTINEEGRIDLELTDTRTRDIEPLRGLPLNRLYLPLTQVTNLGPLKGMPLQVLSAADIGDLSDLSPLRGLRLRELSVGNTAVADLRPLVGMPLASLDLHICPGVATVEALRGMPLRILDLRGTRVADLSPLTGMALERLKLDETQVGDLSALAGMPIRELHLNYCQALPNWASAAEMPLEDFQLSGNRRLESLDFLRGKKLKVLGLTDTDVSDLEPLRGMPLESLYLQLTAVKDLSPLRAMEVSSLSLFGCNNVTDLSPLAEVKGLLYLRVPNHIPDLEFLRGLAGLEALGYQEIRPVEEFWRAYDLARSSN